MNNKLTANQQPAEALRPLNNYVLVRHCEDEEVTRGGIILPDSSRIKSLRCIVLAVSDGLDGRAKIKQYDHVIVDPRGSVPVSGQADNKRFLVPYGCILAVVCKN